VKWNGAARTVDQCPSGCCCRSGILCQLAAVTIWRINPLSELAYKRCDGPRADWFRERAGLKFVTSCNTLRSYLRRGKNALEGANRPGVEPANYARINEYGFVETPYRKVINAVIAR